MIKVSKYEFDSEEQALAKINALPSVEDEDGNDVPSLFTRVASECLLK